jgi:hypothetical protein
MKMKKMAIPAIAAGAALGMGVPVALGTITEVGQSTDTTPPSCPSDPCLAVSRTTGFQAKLGTQTKLLIVPANGRLVAWSIALGAPNAKQIQYFNQNEGGTAEAGIAVLRGGAHLNYTLVASGPLVQLQPYFGEAVQFPLTTTLAVKKGDVIALSVPTWAPALALGFKNDTSWRASRQKKACNNTGLQTTHSSIGTTVQYYCLYRTARLTYSATVISTPTPAKTTTGTTTTGSSTTPAGTTPPKTTSTTTTPPKTTSTTTH